MKKIFFLILCTTVFSSGYSQQKVLPQTGIWRAVLHTQGGELPFGLDISLNTDGKSYTVFVINGDEKLEMDQANILQDSLHIPMELFDSELIGKVSNQKLTGFWRKKRSNGTYVVVKFEAEFGKKYRFFDNEKPFAPNEKIRLFGGKFATTFISEDSKDTTVSVGIFSQKNEGTISGTFLTTTGDYRYLAGNILHGNTPAKDSIFLSCFDGNHAYLFKAIYDWNKNTLNGQLWSNGTHLENWTAFYDEKAKLPDEKSLTFLKKGYTSLNFSFPNEKGQEVSLSDKKYKNKVVIVQILGTWCPNCMDESRFLAPWYKKNKHRGIEIIGLSYEKFTNPAIAFPKISKMKERFGMEYEVLLAGSNDKTASSKTLPMLNQLIGFPTAIFIDRKGIVREIHTGFSGPGTGNYYDNFVEDFNRLLDKLIAE